MYGLTSIDAVIIEQDVEGSRDRAQKETSRQCIYSADISGKILGMDASKTDRPSLIEQHETIFNAGWVFTFALGFVISQAYPTLAEEAALAITMTPMLLLFIFLTLGKDSQATKDS